MFEDMQNIFDRCKKTTHAQLLEEKRILEQLLFLIVIFKNIFNLLWLQHLQCEKKYCCFSSSCAVVIKYLWVCCGIKTYFILVWSLCHFVSFLCVWPEIFCGVFNYWKTHTNNKSKHSSHSNGWVLAHEHFHKRFTAPKVASDKSHFEKSLAWDRFVWNSRAISFT